MLEKPIVVGAAGSGTSILSRLIDGHPDLALIVEPRLTWKYGSERRSDLLRPEDARPEVRDYIRRTFERMVREAGGRRHLEKSPSNSDASSRRGEVPSHPIWRTHC